MNERVLIVEDELSLQETLAYNLKLDGYIVEVTGNGFESVKIAREFQPDLILLDVMLPGMNGFDVCKILRREMDIPILILTARTDEIDRVVGFEIGADDYIIKPFSMRELLARIKTRLRLYRQLHEKKDTAISGSEGSGIIILDNLTINTIRHEVCLNHQPLSLKPKEYDLLCYLATNRGRALSRDLILEQVWGWSYIGNDRTVDVHIRWLRKKIEIDPSHPKRILTVPGIGYRFEG